MARVENNIQVDTDKLLECANEIEQYLVEYEKIINRFFNRINFAEEKPAWIGNNAKIYGNIAMEDKNDYIDFGRNIKKIVKEMKEFAEDLDDTIRTNEDECENGQDSYVSYYYY